jgi:LysM repeat protein
MLGYSAGSMGVGVADDGVTAYYTLEVRPAGTPAPESGASAPGTASVPLTPLPFATLVPATPQPDGSILHLVGYGQTLWSIALAYGIQIDQIRWWNNLDAGSNDIYVGQKLLVRPANLALASPPLPTGPGAQQTGGVTLPSPVNTVQATLTPSPPGNTPTPPGLAVLRPTSSETRADIQRSSKDSPTGSGLLAPILAGSSLLIGCALLLILRKNGKKRNHSDYT